MDKIFNKVHKIFHKVKILIKDISREIILIEENIMIQIIFINKILSFITGRVKTTNKIIINFITHLGRMRICITNFTITNKKNLMNNL